MLLALDLVPSITELTILAVVVGIRIVLSWSLSKEIDRHSADLEGKGKESIIRDNSETKQ
jgi:uncharacterized membrane protein